MTSVRPPIPLAALIAATLLALTALLVPGRADAAISNCTLTITGITFPAYNTVTKAQVDSVGTINVECNGSGTENLTLNITGGNAGGCSPRRMTSGTANLEYNIYRDVTRLSAFCDGANRLDITISFAGNSNQKRSYPMYGRVTANQTPPWGSYSDPVLTVTLKRGGNTLDTRTFRVDGSVSPTCSVSAGTLSFGTYSPASAALGSAAVSVNCSNGAPYGISLSGGQNLSGTTRRMARSGGGYLNYELFSNSLRTTPWGDGTALGAKVSGTGTGNSQSRTVYGRIPAGQSPIPGSYSDRVVVTVDY